MKNKTSWKPRKFGELTQEINLRNSEYKKYEVFSVTNDQGLVMSKKRFKKRVFSKNLKKYKIISPNEVAYNPSRINVGSVAINTSEKRVLLSPMYVIFKCSDEILPKFLLFFLKSIDGINRIRHLTHGSVRDSLNYENFKEIEIDLPSISIQKLFRNEPISGS